MGERAGQNACSVYDKSRVQDGVGPIDPRDSPLFRANDRLPKSWPELQIRLTQLARESLRRQAWPTSGEVVRGFQSDSSRTDSPVRVLHAQPGSRSPRALLKVASAEGPPFQLSRVEAAAAGKKVAYFDWGPTHPYIAAMNVPVDVGKGVATGRSRQDACEPPLPRVPFGTWPAHVVTLGPVGIEQGADEIVEQLGDLGSQELRRWPACISP